MVFDIQHITKYSYDSGVSFCHNLATLKPKSFAGQRLITYDLDISPMPTDLSEREDFFGNTISRFSIQKHHTELIVKAKSRIDREYGLQTELKNLESAKKLSVAQVVKSMEGIESDVLKARQFTLESPLILNNSKEIKNYARKSFKPGRSLFEASYELMQRIFEDFDFVSGFTNIATPLKEVMSEKKGVCQDFAQIAIACLRSMGLPARYVSGYIETIAPEGMEKLIGTDASHAWFSVYFPSFGWMDFDPTNNQIPKNQHIVVAHGRDYFDVPPLKGVIYSTGKNEMEVSVDIRPALLASE